jgi:hypothetical protein
MNRSIACLAISVSTACGGSASGGGSATANGSAGGISIGTVAEAVSITYNGPDCSNASQQQNGVAILLYSTGGHCAAVQAGSTQPQGNALGLVVENVASSSPSGIGPGTYNVQLVSNPLALGVVYVLGANGSCTNFFLSGSGTITLTSVSGSGMAGSYNLTFVDRQGNPNGAISGNFTTSNCAIDQSRFCSNATVHC